jgi:hypothetical protein
MSHISRIKTQMVEQEYLLHALEDLGCTYTVSNILGRESINVRGNGITFHKARNTYECIADQDRIHRSNQQRFLQQVTQRYAYCVTRVKLEKQGFSLVEEEVQEGNRIRLRLRRMV